MLGQSSRHVKGSGTGSLRRERRISHSGRAFQGGAELLTRVARLF